MKTNGFSQPSLQVEQRIRVYPMIKRYQLLFIFPGDPARAMKTTPPTIPWLGMFSLMIFPRLTRSCRRVAESAVQDGGCQCWVPLDLDRGKQLRFLSRTFAPQIQALHLARAAGTRNRVYALRLTHEFSGCNAREMRCKFTTRRTWGAASSRLPSARPPGMLLTCADHTSLTVGVSCCRGMQDMHLWFDYPYQRSNLIDQYLHWCFFLPMSPTKTRTWYSTSGFTCHSLHIF